MVTKKQVIVGGGIVVTTAVAGILLFHHPNKDAKKVSDSNDSTVKFTDLSKMSEPKPYTVAQAESLVDAEMAEGKRLQSSNQGNRSKDQLASDIDKFLNSEKPQGNTSKSSQFADNTNRNVNNDQQNYSNPQQNYQYPYTQPGYRYPQQYPYASYPQEIPLYVPQRVLIEPYVYNRPLVIIRVPHLNFSFGFGGPHYNYPHRDFDNHRHVFNGGRHDRIPNDHGFGIHRPNNQGMHNILPRRNDNQVQRPQNYNHNMQRQLRR